MIREIFMPALSSTMTEGKIVSWTKAPGDRVEKGETVLVVESDKADMDVESFYGGILAAIVVDAGGSSSVGNTLALIAETEEEVEAAKQQAKNLSGGATVTVAAATPTPAAAVETVATVATPAIVNNGRPIVSPRARKIAKQLGVNLDSLKGSGPHGRIVTADVEVAAGKTPTPTAPIGIPTPPPVSAAAPVAATPAATIVSSVPVERLQPFNTLQQAVIRNMVASLAVPTFHVNYTIGTDELDRLAKQLKSKGVTMTALLAKAVAVTLRKHPIVNASYSDTGIQYHGQINVAIAVAMEDGGLITPVLANADTQDIYTLSRNWQDLVSRARSKQLQPHEYNSGTFTISNLGMFGVTNFDAILPPGTGAILAVGASNMQVVATPEGLFGVRRQMQVNMTSDHRTIYGADAASFLKDLASLIEKDVQSLTM
jgi:pyruvate dehydrogenase E2 component (dihydrolipoamide acetyltransferase)